MITHRRDGIAAARGILLAATVCIAFAETVIASPMVISGITTDNGSLDGDVLSIDTATGSLPVSAFASADSDSMTNIVHWVNGSAPATVGEAVSDRRADTGSLSNETLTYNVTPTSPLEALFFVFNAGGGLGFQGPLTVAAVDAGGMPIGNLVSINSNTGTAVINDGNPGTDDAILVSDAFTTYSAARPGSTTLFGRLLAGGAVGVADFGVSDLSTIAGFVFDGENAQFANVNSLDLNLVGLATVPEPASLALIACCASLVASRRRGL